MAINQHAIGQNVSLVTLPILSPATSTNDMVYCTFARSLKNIVHSLSDKYSSHSSPKSCIYYIETLIHRGMYKVIDREGMDTITPTDWMIIKLINIIETRMMITMITVPLLTARVIL